MPTINSLPPTAASFKATPPVKAEVKPEIPQADSITESYTPQATSENGEESRLKVYSTAALIGAVVASPILFGAVVGPVGAILGAGALTALVAYNYEDNSEYHDRPFNALGNFAGLTAMGLIGSTFGLGVGIGAVATSAALGAGFIAAFDDRIFKDK